MTKQQEQYTEIEKEAQKWLDETDTMQFSQMELLTMFAAHQQVKNNALLHDVVLSAYYVNPMGEPIIVLANNIAEACDKLDKAGIKDYIFVHSHSFNVVH